MTLIVLIGTAIFFLGMGLFGLVAPSALIKPFRVELLHIESRTEVRAVYGGFGVGMSILLAAAAANVGGIQLGVCVSVSVALAGMAFGRLVSRFIEGRPFRFYPLWFYFCVEMAAAGALWACCPTSG